MIINFPDYYVLFVIGVIYIHGNKNQTIQKLMQWRFPAFCLCTCLEGGLQFFHIIDMVWKSNRKLESKLKNISNKILPYLDGREHNYSALLL